MKNIERRGNGCTATSVPDNVGEEFEIFMRLVKALESFHCSSRATTFLLEQKSFPYSSFISHIFNEMTMVQVHESPRQR